MGWIDAEKYKAEQAMLKATFYAALLVLVLNFLILAVNWKAYYSRAEFFAQVAQLQQRVEALEAAKTKLDRPQRTPLQPK